jgi:cob(I)alamin adenosyltransferase
MKIYTRQGDDGTTRLGSGKKVPKTDKALEAFGTIDELNSFIGLCRSQVYEAEKQRVINDSSAVDNLDKSLKWLQIKLNAIGAIVSGYGERDKNWERKNYIKPVDIEILETEMDKMTNAMPAQKTLILPAGTVISSTLHISRTVCRRAERVLFHYIQNHSLDKDLLGFMNRLSDYLFICARFVNFLSQTPDEKWDQDFQI